MSSVVPIPARLPLFAEPAGRPGDWWEPLPQVAASAAAPLLADANRRRLPVDLVVALLVEHALIARDIVGCGVDPIRARTALRSAAGLAVISGPGRPNTSYVRVLRAGDRGFEQESEAQLAQRDLLLPLRLHERASKLRVADVCRPDALDEAVVWEVAAAMTGQFMREWALRELLAAVAA